MSFLGPLKTQYDGIIWTTLNKSKGVFGRVDSSEDGQKVRETEEKFLEGVWLGGGEEKKMVRSRCFLLRSSKKISP